MIGLDRGKLLIGEPMDIVVKVGWAVLVGLVIVMMVMLIRDVEDYRLVQNVTRNKTIAQTLRTEVAACELKLDREHHCIVKMAVVPEN